MSDRTREPHDRGRSRASERPLSMPSELPSCRCGTRSSFPIPSCRSPWRARARCASIDDAIANGKLIGVFTQRDAAVEEPEQADLYPVGTATHIHKMFKLPDGSLRLIVQGLARLRLDEIVATRPYLRAARERGAVESSPDDGPPRDRRARSGTSSRTSSRWSRSRRCCPTTCRRSPPTSPTRPARRLHRVEPEHDQHGRQAGGARDASTSARGMDDAQPDPHQGARGPRARVEDPVAGAVRGRQEPARVLPARADEGHPEGARRGRRAGEARSRSSREKIDAAGMPEAVQKEALRELDRLSKMPAGGRRVHRRAHLPRLAHRPALEQADRGGHRPAAHQGACSTPTTRVSRRRRTASSSTSPCAS